jgi:anti-sigma B factor antagonist
MPISAKKRKGAVALHIEGAMTVSTAAALKKDLMKHIAKPGEREIVLTEVSEMDSAGIQLLMLAKREATRRGRPLRLTGHSPAVLGVIDTYDLAAYFGDPILISGSSQS